MSSNDPQTLPKAGDIFLAQELELLEAVNVLPIL